ncbi:MAG: FNIP repeat-containing protein [Terracidiphilus sp.]|nr:FNIP repeat-containing protein [Terracidiphilus sp.]
MLGQLPGDMARSIGEFLFYGEQLRLSYTNKTLRAQLQSVAVWEAVWVQRQLEHPTALGMNHLRCVVVTDAAQLAQLQSSVQHLIIDESYPQTYEFDTVPLPARLTSLTLHEDINTSAKNLRLPPNLRHLTFNSWVHHLSPLRMGPQPEGEHTTLVSYPVTCAFPDTLTYLDFCRDFNHPIDQLRFPASLTYLELGDCFNQPIEDLLLPDGLAHLQISNAFKQPIGKLRLPAALRGIHKCELTEGGPVERFQALPCSAEEWQSFLKNEDDDDDEDEDGDGDVDMEDADPPPR